MPSQTTPALVPQPAQSPGEPPSSRPRYPPSPTPTTAARTPRESIVRLVSPGPYIQFTVGPRPAHSERNFPGPARTRRPGSRGLCRAFKATVASNGSSTSVLSAVYKQYIQYTYSLLVVRVIGRHMRTNAIIAAGLLFAFAFSSANAQLQSRPVPHRAVESFTFQSPSMGVRFSINVGMPEGYKAGDGKSIPRCSSPTAISPLAASMSRHRHSGA